MDNKHFIKWIPHSDVVAVYDMETSDGVMRDLF